MYKCYFHSKMPRTFASKTFHCRELIRKYGRKEHTKYWNVEQSGSTICKKMAEVCYQYETHSYFLILMASLRLRILSDLLFNHLLKHYNSETFKSIESYFLMFLGKDLSRDNSRKPSTVGTCLRVCTSEQKISINSLDSGYTSIGPYRFKENDLIGKGFSSRVYKATHSHRVN